MSLNRVCLIGRLTRDPQSKTTNSGKTYCNFSIAVNKRIKPQDGSSDADFFNVKAWEQTAEYVTNYLEKGRLVAIDGRIETRKYEKEGVMREVYEIVADNVNGLDRPKERQEERIGKAPKDDYDPYEDE